MAIDAIGSVLDSTSSELTTGRLDQQDFIKLFLTQLTYQDPLEPVDNREFLAQMAQFANLEQSRISNENSENLVRMSASSQSIGLLGRQVEVSGEGGSSFIGAVTAVTFSGEGPVLTIRQADDSVLTDVRLAQVKLIRI